MPTELISLDEASWRLEQVGILGGIFAELLAKSPAILLGIHPGSRLRDPVNLSRVTSVRAEPGNILVADNIAYTDVKLDWHELKTAFESRGCKVNWNWFSDITPELLERAHQPSQTRRRLDDLRPRVPITLYASEPLRAPRGASSAWFGGSVFTSAVPASGKPPRGKRGRKSGKRELTAATIRRGLEDGALTVAALTAMPEKELAARYGVSRDTARKAKNDALSR